MKGVFRVDALVVGGGIAGLTAAHLLQKAGARVALLEKGWIGRGESGRTTAHLTYPTDKRLIDLVDDIGENHAEAVWDAQKAAMMQIEQNVLDESLDCDYKHVPGYLYASIEGEPVDASRLRMEARLARKLHFDATFISSAPIVKQPAICYANQAKFHPYKYLTGLAASLHRAGAHVYENSEVLDFEDDPQRAIGEGFTVHYNHLFIATQVPLQGNRNALSAALLQTKLAAYSTYAVGAKLHSAVPEALFWDTSDPYLYLRIDHRHDGKYVILGGEDHKTGQDCDTRHCFETLGQKLRGIFPEAVQDHHWSGQVIETLDGLPYIGETGEGQFVATGFSGTGMTFGTLSGMMFRDYVLGIQNPWRDLFSVDRKKCPLTWDYLKENKDYPYYLLKRMLTGASDTTASSLLCGEGKILWHKGCKTAAYRDPEGKLSLLSPICPHMGCVVCWNVTEKTWDCPCHGSRFSAAGEVRAGPAEKPLTPLTDEDSV